MQHKKFIQLLSKLRLFLFFLLLTKVMVGQPKAKLPNAHNGATSATKDGLVILHFGTNGQIRYHLKQGTADVLYGTNKIIGDAYAVVATGNTTYNSKDYQKRVYSKSAFKDEFGQGLKHVVVLSSLGKATMEQIFYTYTTQNYFFTEVSLSGQHISSNYMAPLVSEKVNIFAASDNRTILVPFDNDTFISYNAKSMSSPTSNTSAEVGAFYDNKSRKGLILGSVEHMVWKTGIKTVGQNAELSKLEVWGGYTEAAITRDTIPHGFVSGNELKSPKIFVGYFTDWRNGLEAYGKANHICEKPYVFNWTKPTPLGWNSWGVMQEHIDFAKATAVVDFFADSLKNFRNDNTAFIDLNSYWDKLVKGGMNGDLSKLTEFVTYCKNKGLQPGAYWGPFTDWGYNHNGSEKRVIEGGTQYTYGDAWTKTGGHFHNIDGARALDPTHPGTRQRINLFISKLKECGFTMIKLDFLGHATVEGDSFYDKSVTTGMQAYRKGMEYLVDQLGDQMLIYAAISPSLATGRYVHTRRIACDAFKSIRDTRYTLNSVNYGWWQTYVYNYIDADHVVFSNESDGANRARLASSLITGTLITGDDYSKTGKWSKTAKQLLQKNELLKIAKNGVAFKPVEGNTGDTTNALFVKQIGQYYYLAVFNFTGLPKTEEITLERIGLKSSQTFDVVELFSGARSKAKASIKVKTEASDVAIYKIKL